LKLTTFIGIMGSRAKDYEGNREAHAELMGDHTENYMEYQYADNGYDSLSATQNNNIGTNVFNGHGVSQTVQTNTQAFSEIDQSELDPLCINSHGCYGDQTEDRLLRGEQGTIGKIGNYILDGITQDKGETFDGYVMINPETGNTITIKPEELHIVQQMAKDDPEKFKNYMAIAEMQSNSTHTSQNAVAGLHDDGYLGGTLDAWGQYAASGEMLLDMAGGGAGNFVKQGEKIGKYPVKQGSIIPDYHQSNFTDSAYINRQVNGEEVFYRYHGEDNRLGQTHTYVTDKKYNSEAELREETAILNEWGVDISKVTTIKPQRDTWISEGTAAPQIGIQGESRSGN